MPHELSITTFIDAPPETVWQIMAYRQEEWWCPRPWRAVFDVQERRAGGRCDVTMHGPDGEQHRHGGIYLAWDEGRRFISTDAVTGDFQPADPFIIGVWEIAPEGTGTRYTATARHWTAEASQRHADMGFDDGWSACMAQLKELCEAAGR
ncbi:MAG: hypothetical protein RLZZ08_1360 [Pseudomonadota bacterium]